MGGEGVGAPIYSAPAPLSLGMHMRAEKAPRQGEEGCVAPSVGNPPGLSSQEISHGGQEALAASCVVVGSTAGRVVCLQFPCWPHWSPHLEHQEVAAGQLPSPGRTARVVWSRNVGSPVFAPASVCPAESTVLIPCAGARLLSVHAQTGEEVWSFAARGPLMSAALVISPVALDDTMRIIVGCHKGWVYCVDAKHGRACWQRELVPHLPAPVAGVYV